MELQNLDAQYKLFLKYWFNGSDNENIRDYQTADKLREKILPQVESLLDEDNETGLSTLLD
ncbi:MAG: hypothetical protein H6668_03045 [Ardenticatenaceae bacterium]|nr:hypothetical protein [Ardenticatenaceae bacterium]